MKFSRQRKRNKNSNSTENQRASIDQEFKFVNYKLAAAYVKDAIEGRFYKAGLGKNLQENQQFSVWCLYLSNHFVYKTFLFLVVGFHSFVSAYEPVQMISKPSTNLNPIALWGGVSCCLVYIIDIGLNLSYCRPRQFFSFYHCRLFVWLSFLITLDYILYVSCGRMIFRGLRPVLLMFRIHSLRSTGLVMLGVTPKFLQFLLIMGAYVTVFAVIGVHLFMYTYIENEVVRVQHEGIYEGAFNHTGIALLEVFVLMTGGSYPRFMIPAYVQHRTVSLFYFITIIMTGEIILYAILVARIYDFYMEANKSHVKEERHHERQCLIRAFEIIDIKNVGYLAYAQWKGLLKALRSGITSSEVNKRFRKLKELSKLNVEKYVDENTNDDYWRINMYEFFYLPDVLQFTVEKSKTRRSIPTIPSQQYKILIYLRYIGQKITLFCRTLYHHKASYYISLLINVLYIAPFGLLWYNMSPQILVIIYKIEFLLIFIITAEIIIQFIALGPSYMLEEMSLHVVMVVVAICCMIYIWSSDSESWNEGWVPVLANLAMLVRLSGFKRKSSSMMHYLRRIAPPLLTLLCVTEISFYTFAIIGMESFGSIRTVKHLPNGISLCRYGFESLGCSLLTLFQISLGSSWHKVMHFIMDVVNSWCCVYFVFFYALMQMLVLNIISAVMVELSNAIYNDENQAKRRDKEFETREDLMSRNTETTTTFTRKKISSTSMSSAITAVTIATTDWLSPENDVSPDTEPSSSLQVPDLYPNLFPSKSNENDNVFTGKRVSISTDPPVLLERSTHLPCIVEEDQGTENLDEMTLTGRKELGKWTREILPDMTFLNAEDLKRLQAEMGQSVGRLHYSKAKSRTRTTSINSNTT